ERTPRAASGAMITGRVTDRATGEPVPGTLVAVEGTRLAALADSAGRYRLADVPPGPQVLQARRIGYAPARVPVTAPAGGTVPLAQDIALARTALQLERVLVTADPAGRAKGELGTASVIDRDAIANQTAASLAGVLELVPGVVLSPPGLDGFAQIGLRAVPTTTTGPGLTQGDRSGADIASFGTLIVLDGVPLSNNANLQSLGPRGEIGVPTAAGGGIDLRRIPAATLERVEVIRGLPSARYGDLTQGAIVVETRAAEVAPEGAIRFDARTVEASLLGGRGLVAGRHALTSTLNYAQTRVSPGLTREANYRVAGQLAHRARLGRQTGEVALGGDANARGAATLDADRTRLTLDTRLDYWQLSVRSPEQPEILPGRASFTRDYGLRLAERARLALSRTAAVELTAAYDRTIQRSDIQALRTRPAQAFTDRLTEGRSIGRFVAGDYLARVRLAGDPRLLYLRLEGDVTRALLGFDGRLRAGGELRREWNAGPGYQFDIATPPQSTFNGVQGFDRPRRNDSLPAVASSAVYLDGRFTRPLPAGMSLDVQPGLRLDVLHDGTTWLSASRSAAMQPRLNAQLSPRPWLRLRGAVGRTAKLPSTADLYPAAQWFDVVNVNRFTPAPAERLAVLTTFVRDPTNPGLGLSRATKREAGLELDLGLGRQGGALGGTRGGTLAVTRYDDEIRGAVAIRREPEFLLRDIYALADTGRGTGRPGRIVEPAIGADTVPIFLDRPANGATLGSSGWEVTLALPEIPAVRTRVEVAGAWTETRFRSGDTDFGPFTRVSSFQVDQRVPRIPYWEGAERTGKRDLVTYRLIHQQPDLGLVVTAVVQQTVKQERRDIGGTDTLSWAGYVTRAGKLVPVPMSERGNPEFRDVRFTRTGLTVQALSPRPDWIMGLQVAKTMPLGGRLSFYAFNVLDKTGNFGDATHSSLLYPPVRFGLELTMPSDALLGGRW
ncbi:MAG: TonB-dependent receptor, partial [Gemmatimonadaceae bacterium]